MRELGAENIHVSITAFRQTDVEACARIMATSSPWDRYGITLDLARKRFEGPLGHGGRIRLAIFEEDIVGFVWFYCSGTFYYGGLIRYIGVKEEYRSKGIGRALLEVAERDIFAHTSSVFLLVSHFNHRAQHFYEVNGYHKVGELPDYVTTGVTEYIYCKYRGAGNTSPGVSGHA